MNSNSNKVRIIALYIQYREGVPDEDRRRLYQHARLTRPEVDAVNALVHLGMRINRVRYCLTWMILSFRALTRVLRGPQGPGDKDLKRRIKQKQSSDEEYELSRYKPLIRTVIEVRLRVSPLVIAHRAGDGGRTTSMASSTRPASPTSRTILKLRLPHPACGQRQHRRPRCGVQSRAGIVQRAQPVRRAKRANGCSCSSRAV